MELVSGDTTEPDLALQGRSPPTDPSYDLAITHYMSQMQVASPEISETFEGCTITPSIVDAQVEPPETFETFHPFPRLPIELRLEIWGFSEPRGHESRTIEVIQKCINFQDNDESNFGHFYTDALLPALLYTNRESREVGLKTYKVLEVSDNTPYSVTADILTSDYQDYLRASEAMSRGGYYAMFSEHESPGRPRIPSSVRFATYIDFGNDLLYINSAHMRTDNMPKTHYSSELVEAVPRPVPRFVSSAIAPCLRFLEALVWNDEARASLKSIAFNLEAFEADEHTGLQTETLLHLMRLPYLRDIYIVVNEGHDSWTDVPLSRIPEYDEYDQCRISYHEPLGIAGEWYGFVSGLTNWLARVAVAQLGFFHNHAPMDLPSIHLSEVWRYLPAASDDSDGADESPAGVDPD